MNIEIGYIHMIRNGLRIRYYGGKALTAVRTVLRRPAATGGHYRRKDAEIANIEKERFSAVAIAQVQSYRFNR